MLEKVGTVITKANLRAAHLEAEDETHKHQLDSATVTQKRKRVNINLKEKFGDLNSITAVMDRETALQSKQISRQGGMKA